MVQRGMRVCVGILEVLAGAAAGHERTRPRQVVRQQSIVIREPCGVGGVIAAAMGESAGTCVGRLPVARACE